MYKRQYNKIKKYKKKRTGLITIKTFALLIIIMAITVSIGYSYWNTTLRITGTVDIDDNYEPTIATFNTGTSVNSAIKALSGYSSATAIKKATSISNEYLANATNVASGDIPIYIWVQNNIIYYYSEADELYLNADSSKMFTALSNNIKEVELNFKADNVTTMERMFYNSKGLTSLDVSKLNTSKVKNMAAMFGNLTGLTTLDLSTLKTGNVTTMNGMFNGSLNLTSLNVSNFDTHSLKNMEKMFSSTKSLTVLDVSSFDTSSVTVMTKMFDNMINLETIYASPNFVTTNVTISTNMFINDTKLVGGNGTKYDANNYTHTRAVIDTAVYDNDDNLISGTPGYFTLKQ